MTRQNQGAGQISNFSIKGQVFEAPVVAPGLYIAATPIGNLGDVTIRVLETLAGSDFIACEDTRVTAKLLRHYAISTKAVSYHEHNANITGPKLIEELKADKAIILVSDAGTPLVSDPGSRLVKSAREAGIKVYPLPGASAPLAALVASGLPAASWTFTGFLPSRQGARISALKAHIGSDATVIFFESPNRLGKTLRDMEVVFGPDRLACVARELTKLHEEVTTAPISQLATDYSDRTVKGEVVVLVAPREEDAQDPDDLLRELLQSMPLSQAATQAASLTGLSKRDLYQRALAIREEK